MFGVHKMLPIERQAARTILYRKIIGVRRVALQRHGRKIAADKSASSAGGVRSNINTHGNAALCKANNPLRRRAAAALTCALDGAVLNVQPDAAAVTTLVTPKPAGWCDAIAPQGRRRYHAWRQNTIIWIGYHEW